MALILRVSLWLPVWISPTIVNKDREDLPFLERDHIYALKR